MRQKTNSVKIFTVSEINGLIKDVLESGLPGQLTVSGEITDWKVHQKGHCYFSLKDQHSVLPSVMWKENAGRLKFKPENGLAVLATGSIDLYVPHGRYKFVVDELIPAGVGALQLAFEQMVKKLRAEGLFDEAHKKPLPQYPQRIGILTSESGAALHDITHSIWSRWPCVKLFLSPVPVQGEGAAVQIAAAIRDVNRRNKTLNLDLLIVGRGGGSLEDLWAFNEEVLARAIYDSRIPIISAVGHEVDVTVADLVADARASTPTKAGVVAVPDMEEVLADLANKQNRLLHKMAAKVDLGGQMLETVLASAVFKNPLLMVHNRELQLDELGMNLGEVVKGFMAEARQKLHEIYEQIVKIEPHRLLGRHGVVLKGLEGRGQMAIQSIVNRLRVQLVAQENKLAGLNPRAVLRRGYSITRRKESNLVVRAQGDIQVGDLLVTELVNENLIESRVTKK
jgi:exodeoxyribonuclease VII large subunit